MSTSKNTDHIEIRLASTETKLISSAVALARSHKKFERLQIAEAPMDVGDIGVYYAPSDDTTEPELMFLIERKSKSDLQASFIDHRYQEQALRLHAHPDLKSPRQVIYLLECTAAEESRMSETDKMEWFRTQSSLLVKPGHDFLVMQTKSTEESALLILSFASKVLEILQSGKKHAHLYPEQATPYFYQGNSLGYTATSKKYVEDKLIETTILQTKKQGNLTPQMFFITTLGCIPNMGAEMAKAVALSFPGGFTDLLRRANEDPASFVDEIAALKFGSTKRQSSIGKTRATQMLKFLCPMLQVSENQDDVQQGAGEQEDELQEGHSKKSGKHSLNEEDEDKPYKKKWIPRRATTFQ